MAQYKVPQDVEADDKLIGPLIFRQFVYLLICGGLIALAVGLFQIFPMLAIIPVPFLLFFGALALPLKKDQPMETYLAALLSYYLKPRSRKWEPGQKNNMILITAPKIEEDNRARDITGEEATHRLSFLADIVDTEGYAIKGVANNSMRDELKAEASMAEDMFETKHFDNLGETIMKDENERHAEVIKEMREAIDKVENIGPVNIMKTNGEVLSSSVEPGPVASIENKPVEKHESEEHEDREKVEQKPLKSSIIELANNPDYSVATIAKEAERINKKDEGEVFISLH
ncbi:MAG: PrgI family protein [Candidatus Saccharibacteria bacterium]|nr:PrgI family protein [Candidatus Saccharibacteria bacterium]